MSESNRTLLAYIREQVPGTTPGAGDYKKIPFTAAPDFSFNPTTVQSSEIRSDRQTDDLSLVGIEAGGSVELEFSYGRYDDLIEAALYDNWNELETAGSTEIQTIANGQLEFSSAGDIPDSFKKSGIVLIEDGGDQDHDSFEITAISGVNVSLDGLDAADKGPNFKATLVGLRSANANWTFVQNRIVIDNVDAKSVLENVEIEKGDWIVVNSPVFSERAYFRITSKTINVNATTLTFDAFFNAPETDFSRPTSQTHKELYFSRSLKNGVTEKSFSILQAFQSADPVAQAIFSGCRVGTFGLTFDTQAIITATLGFLGLNSRYLTDLIPANRIKDQLIEELLNSSSNVGQLLIDGTVVSSPNYIQSGSLNIENNVRRQNAVGSIGSVGLPAGSCVVTGALTTYFGNKSLAEDVINNTEKSYILNLTDKKKRRFLIDVPRLKFSAGSVGIAGSNTDLVLPLEYQAIRHKELNYQLKLCAFPFV